MRLELVSIPTPTTPLDGLLYEPDGGATAGGVLLFHGNTMNFYVGALRFLPPALTRLGFACLAFNRRGHDIMSIRNSRKAEGAEGLLAGDRFDEIHARACKLVADCDHFYNRKEDEVTELSLPGSLASCNLRVSKRRPVCYTLAYLVIQR